MALVVMLMFVRLKMLATGASTAVEAIGVAAAKTVVAMRQCGIVAFEAPSALSAVAEPKTVAAMRNCGIR